MDFFGFISGHFFISTESSDPMSISALSVFAYGFSSFNLPYLNCEPTTHLPTEWSDTLGKSLVLCAEFPNLYSGQWLTVVARIKLVNVCNVLIIMLSPLRSTACLPWWRWCKWWWGNNSNDFFFHFCIPNI